MSRITNNIIAIVFNDIFLATFNSVMCDTVWYIIVAYNNFDYNNYNSIVF